MGNLLLSAGGWGWILDVIFFVVLFLYILFGVKAGLVLGISKLAGWLFSLACAFMACVAFSDFLENLFGMTTGLANWVSSWFSSEAMTADLSKFTTIEGLSEYIPTFFAEIVVEAYGGQALPAGTTGAMLVGSIVGKWFAIAISFILLIFLIRLGVWLIAKILTRFIDKVPVLGKINRILGGIFGLFKGILLLFFIFAVCSWIPWGGLHSFISSSTIVGAIFNSEWFAGLTSYVISFEWLTSFLQG